MKRFTFSSYHDRRLLINTVNREIEENIYEIYKVLCMEAMKDILNGSYSPEDTDEFSTYLLGRSYEDTYNNYRYEDYYDGDEEDFDWDDIYDDIMANEINQEIEDKVMNCIFEMQDKVIRAFIKNEIIDVDSAEDIEELVDDIRDEIDGETMAWEAYSVAEKINETYGERRILEIKEVFLNKVKIQVDSVSKHNKQIDELADKIKKEYIELGNAIPYEGINYITKKDKKPLNQLREQYSHKEIIALREAGKLRFSNTLDYEYPFNAVSIAEKELGIERIHYIHFNLDYDFLGLNADEWEALEERTRKDVREFYIAEEEKERKREEKRKRKEKARREAKEAEEGILKTMPDTYAEMFPGARQMDRHFIIHSGPTNSGKTYTAIERLKSAENGVYLGPLRLLAYEQYEKLNSENVPCTLLTGEEHNPVDNARVTSSTIEMLDIKKTYDVAVIDEAQMIVESDRGGAWSNAILGIKAKEVHVCCAPEAKELIIRIINECDDTYEVEEHTRKTPLKVGESAFNFPKNVEKGDALIVFSRKNVHAVAAALNNRKLKSSIIYGALPYDVRHEQAAMFTEGKTDVVVATDAIGMGMNLPIKRIVFLEMNKFDGKTSRTLKPEEVRQIAGRAGRYGIYDTGYAVTEEKPKILRRLYSKKATPHTKAVIQFPEMLLGLQSPLLATLREWTKLDANEGWKKADAERMIALIERVGEEGIDKRLLYDLITMPFDEEDMIMLEMWKKMFYTEKTKSDDYDTLKDLRSVEWISSFADSVELDVLEKEHKKCDLAYTYYRKFHPDKKDEMKQVSDIRNAISKQILKKLEQSKLQPKRCKYCKKILPWNTMFSMCEDCHDERYGYRDDYHFGGSYYGW